MPYKPHLPLGDALFIPIPDPVIEVTIAGSNHHIGKTTVAAVIAKALTNAGFKHIHIHTKDDDFDTVTKEALTPEGVVNDQKTLSTEIHIYDMNETIKEK